MSCDIRWKSSNGFLGCTLIPNECMFCKPRETFLVNASIFRREATSTDCLVRLFVRQYVMSDKTCPERIWRLGSMVPLWSSRRYHLYQNDAYKGILYTYIYYICTYICICKNKNIICTNSYLLLHKSFQTMEIGCGH